MDDNGVDMKWIRSLTGKDRIRDEDLKPEGSRAMPKLVGSNVTYLDCFPGMEPKDDD